MCNFSFPSITHQHVFSDPYHNFFGAGSETFKGSGKIIIGVDSNMIQLRITDLLRIYFEIRLHARHVLYQVSRVKEIFKLNCVCISVSV